MVLYNELPNLASAQGRLPVRSTRHLQAASRRVCRRANQNHTLVTYPFFLFLCLLISEKPWEVHGSIRAEVTMDPVSLVAAITGVVSVIMHRPLALFKLYGARGLVYYVFGNRTTWRAEMRVLGDLKPEDAFNFKKSVQEECAMISVAVSLAI